MELILAINPFEKSSHFDRHFFPFLPTIHTEVSSIRNSMDWTEHGEIIACLCTENLQVELEVLRSHTQNIAVIRLLKLVHLCLNY